MNLATCLTRTNSSGLFELNNDGTVRYSRLRQNNELINADPEMVGHNFFEEIAGFENVRDLRRIFNNFVKSNKFTDNFVFDCQFPNETIRVRVMMVRAFENSYPKPADIVILDIRNGAY
ncbi:MAG TPA: hypothetical protein VIL74_09445 [Pyrinomonadaceae bacterium]|jgi:hypothetical protein